MPRCSDSATFSAACRQTLHERKRLSPSFHSLVALSRNRGVDAMRNLATAAPLGVNRSSGSSTRFPTRVIWVSLAIWVNLPGRLSRVGTDDFCPEDCFVQVELPVEFLDRIGRCHQVNHCVDPLDPV